ncbi:MAG: P1 family peptidase [Methanobacteriota archaeon]|nr:MAG: P1 family peptidase [Euryarchaeota archaeon]
MSRPRAREAGVRFGSLSTGKKNSIADVAGVSVGHSTLRRGEGKLVVGEGPVRTGVTVVVPHEGDLFRRPVKGAYYSLNGCGALIGALQIQEFGLIDTPIGLTNTMSICAVGEGLVRYTMDRNPLAGVEEDTIIPIVSECDDSYLNDARGLHVRPEHVFEAIGNASSQVEEGSVGAGTGMVCHDFKGGIGTASRAIDIKGSEYLLGVLVLANHGNRNDLLVDGVPVGRLLDTLDPKRKEMGSIVTIVATDAPVDARQLKGLAKRVSMGLGMTGSCAHKGSGDIMIAFSTANVHDRRQTDKHIVTDKLLVDSEISNLYRGVVDATAESVTNALFKAETEKGRDDQIAPALPLEPTIEILKAHGRIE